MRSVPEADWKKIRVLKDKALQDACQRIFDTVKVIIEGGGQDKHKAYLTLWKTLQTEDDEISRMFDDVKRSNALYKLAAWKRNGLVADEDWEQFSKSTRQTIDVLNRA